jgi:hypothetical protein
MRPSTRSRHWLVLLVVTALVVPSNASAHVRSATVAVDYKARVFAPTAWLRRVLAARVYQSDRAVRLSVAPGHTALVLGYLREPFLRFSSQGIDVNASAPTAGSAGLTKLLPRRAAGWQRLSSERSVTWHDNRLRGLPAGVDHARWRIPLVVDGKPAALEGDLSRIRAPAWWPWLLAAIPFVLGALLVIRRRRSAAPLAAGAFGIATAAGMIASGAGFAFDTYASSGKWVEFGNELVLGLVGVAVILRGSPVARGIAGGALGLLGLWAGPSKSSVLLHGLVLSIYPPTLARALVVLTTGSAAAATALGLVVYGTVFESGVADVDAE